MFRKHGFKILTILIVLLFTAVYAHTHSGRTDKYGGHYDRKNGGYHYHNSGTVPRPTTRSTTPSRTTTPNLRATTPSRTTNPQLSTLQSEGSKPYTPTRLEWLALDLNAGVPYSFIKYYTTDKANTLIVCVYYDSATTTLKQRQAFMKYAKECIINEAKIRGWDWLKLEENYKDLNEL